jgi:O-antigen/teichoic acid export membrane protein
MLFLAAPMVTLTIMNAQPIISLIYSSEYAGSSAILATMIWSMFFAFLSSPFHRALDATARQKTLFLIILAGTAANILINIVYIPSYGAMASAWAAVAGQMAFLIIPAVHCIRSGLKPQISAKYMVTFFASTAAMVATAKMIAGYGFAASIIIPSITYLTVYTVSGQMREILRFKDYDSGQRRIE